MDRPRKPLSGPAEEYQIGYAKPPESGQFKKGQSGNLKGRPKKDTTIAAALQLELETFQNVTINGRPARKTKNQIIAMLLVKKGLEGNLPAIAKIYGLQAPSPARGSKRGLGGVHPVSSNGEPLSADELAWAQDFFSHSVIANSHSGEATDDDEPEDGATGEEECR